MTEAVIGVGAMEKRRYSMAISNDQQSLYMLLDRISLNA